MSVERPLMSRLQIAPKSIRALDDFEFARNRNISAYMSAVDPCLLSRVGL